MPPRLTLLGFRQLRRECAEPRLYCTCVTIHSSWYLPTKVGVCRRGGSRRGRAE